MATAKNRIPLRLPSLTQCLSVCAILSATLLAGAFAFEHVGGFAPCKLCIWQRWAHVAIIYCSLTPLIIQAAGSRLGISLKPDMPMLGLAFAACVASTTIAGYHTGVELRIWFAPTGCSSVEALTGTTSQITDLLLAMPVTRCDVVPWSLFGVSMAGWNTLFSAGMSLFVLSVFVANVKPKGTG